MQVSNAKAEPNPRGGRIDLSWTNPGDNTFGGVKILRRESAFPEKTDVGTEREVGDLPVATWPAGAPARFVDANLQGETIYYYALVPYDGAHNPSTLSFVSAMATTPYQTAAHLYKNLPAIYRRYDTNLPPDITTLEPADRGKGQLQRFVEMFGLQFDLLRSFASGMDSFHDRERVDGGLLPLLASWIGWETNYALDFDKQRGEIQYAPPNYRTTGIAAGLRATVNRLVIWDTSIKEFVHNVFLSTGPEQLTIWEKRSKEGVWQNPQLVSLDVAYEGRPATLLTADNRQWLFQHARQSPPLSSDPALKKVTQDHWHVWYKIYDHDAWLPAHRVSFRGDIHKYPAAIEDREGRVWVFWTGYRAVGAQSIPEIKLALLAAGQPARPARAQGTVKGPYPFVDGETFQIRVTTAGTSFTRLIIFRPEHFQVLANATAAETAALLDREIPDVTVTASVDGEILLKTISLGSTSQLEFPASPVAAKLGLTGTTNGSNAVAAELTGTQTANFALAEGDTLSIRIDDRISRVITFKSFNFTNIALATAGEVAAAINLVLPGVAQAVGNKVKLTSTTPGEASSIVMEVFPPLLFNLASSLKPALDSGIISPQIKSEFTRAGRSLSSAATLSIQTAGIQWLIADGTKRFLVRLEEGKLNVYNPSLAAPKLGFGVPLPASPSIAADSEPAVVRDNDGRIWLFWSSRRNGPWKIWFNRFEGGSWGIAKPLTAGPDADHEPAALFVPSGGGRIWVFWSRKKANGLWNIFFITTNNLNFDTSTEEELEPVPPNYDNREPTAIVQLDGADPVELYFSSDRADGWHIWSKVISNAQGGDLQVNSGQFSQRASAVLKLSDQLKKLYFRSNESQVYTSSFYPSAQTIDARYSGSTTVDTRNPAKISLRKNIQDVQRYTYDTLKTNENWYARDTVGIYLVPDTIDQALVIRRRNQIENVLRRFLPIQVRTVFIVDQVVSEFFYTYDAAETEPTVLLGEGMIDTISSEAFWGPLSKADRGPDETRSDGADFRWLRTLDETNRDGLLPDLRTPPAELPFRLFLTDVAEPGEE